ncbi:LysR family transcriptional regulator, hydrogen peroxide-inducible genes activator [Rheinheimera pacifica]|uniref:LysR family transcriptional regulator, hydrogen peroxide-inducible genes activator n=1 Tax=Rheinheimera pacifica TaxID=173990 RepID=A0A1H6JHD9_9GAMM|nr:hydrogen peroxide-inducible genes activator [Rheinheimera pacifica]MDR6983100.1 LysR family hydrogen peroxide-inducible transcriptional activator [Rheinheimera pacifica]PKM18575.1 MAG: hydrogen peroxide-inducible genes activator [Gammaproteobacteria bacterium HGW-Gammaproteobacteria-15]SEH58512.1 LysR family transcriptional regulator, hydrogen peroxide-inducible genes activator [Rheinheimera pacifica]
MKRLPSIKQLQYLLALHEHQHFGRAAEACYIGQSTLSAAIANLEETMDAQLLERDHKTFIFTPLGEDVVRQARHIIEQCGELTEFAKCQGKPMTGPFRLGCIPTIAPFVLSEVMALCRQRYPDLQLLLREDTSENSLHALAEGRLDMVLLALPYETGAFHTEVLSQDAFKLVLHKDWLNRGFNQDISQWPDESIFLLEREHCLTNHAVKACELEDSRKVNPFFATSLHTLTQMVNNKLGVTFMPQMAINSGLLDGTELVTQAPTTGNAYRDIGVAWRPTSTKARSYRLMADLISEVLQQKCR